MANIMCLGLDGSLRNFGFAVCEVDMDTKKIVSSKVFLSQTKPLTDKKISKSVGDLISFRQHWLKMNQLIDEYKCTIAFGEIPSGAKDARAALAFGGVIGLMSALPIKLVTVTPSQVKVASAGNKHADKEDIIEWASNGFPNAGWKLSSRPNKMSIKVGDKFLTNDNEHQADAIAAVAAGILKDG